MDSNQTIQLKPVYGHPHIGIYNGSVISTTLPTLSFASSLNIVDTSSVVNTVNSDTSNSLGPLAIIQPGANSANVGPVTAANVCLNNLQIQQFHMQTLSQGQFESQCTRSGNVQGENHLLQLQITTPTSQLSNITSGASDNQSSANSQDPFNAVAKSSHLIPDTSSNLSSGSSLSGSSDANQSPFNMNGGIKRDAQKNLGDPSDSNYINLARASCSSNTTSSSVSSMKIEFSKYKSLSGRGFKCQICNRDFTQKGNLKTHLMTHSGERPYECPTCGKNFTQKGNLDTHVKIHTETKDHKCQFCDRGFTQRGNLKTHIRSIHTKEKPYACGHCGKAFSQKGNMLTHYRTHDKDSRFPCNVCGKTFSQKGNLRTHQQRHGRGPGR